MGDGGSTEPDQVEGLPHTHAAIKGNGRAGRRGASGVVYEVR